MNVAICIVAFLHFMEVIAMTFFTNRIFPRPLFNTKSLVTAAIFIALNIIFTYIFAIQTPFIRVSFTFLPIAIFSMLFGPLRGGLVAAIADILGCFIFSPALFFPGFTLSAFMSGMIYGYFFYNKKITLSKIIIVNLIIFLFIVLTLNTLWFSILYHNAAQLFFLGRFLKCLILLPLQIAMIYAVYKPLKNLAVHHKISQ